jgi:transcription antitermination protein NusB
MISRRNIRIKAMQSLYALLTAHTEWEATQGIKNIQYSIENGNKLCIALVNLAKLTAQYAIIDADKRSNKHLPSNEDLNVSTKISNSTVVRDLDSNPKFEAALSQFNLNNLWDIDLVSKIYKELIATAEYAEYTSTHAYKETADQLIFNKIIEVISSNELYYSTIEESFANYEDDIVMIQGWISKNLAQIKSTNFTQLMSKDKTQFAHELVETFLDKYTFTQELIKPKLTNWDPERIAIIDMIILQMGITELLYFESIPTKVTINEYIDIGKLYSTMQSGQFVNGVLDNIHKDLVKENKINKTNFQK